MKIIQTTGSEYPESLINVSKTTLDIIKDIEEVVEEHTTEEGETITTKYYKWNTHRYLLHEAIELLTNGHIENLQTLVDTMENQLDLEFRVSLLEDKAD